MRGVQSVQSVTLPGDDGIGVCIHRFIRLGWWWWDGVHGFMDSSTYSLLLRRRCSWFRFNGYPRRCFLLFFPWEMENGGCEIFMVGN